ncbi:MAG: LysM peptidoglycan-binding domain-containing protein [Firmicutes bacterium]|nr:LysM peptidoglycan-binding domain-containing protein [Bacillota bacterium]
MHPRVPKHCPPGFMGRYTVVPGDTMFFIAQRFGVSLDALIAANPHIPNPNLIFPGDVLCVPQKFPPPPPPPKKDCPCPVTLFDFINRLVEVTTECGVVVGNLDFVGEDSIILSDPKTKRKTIVLCREICFVRVLKHFREEGNDEF